jgi:hypothetical protein
MVARNVCSGREVPRRGAWKADLAHDRWSDVAKKPQCDSPDLAILQLGCCNNAAPPRVLHRFSNERGGCNKNRLPSVQMMAKMRERWRDDHRHTRICGRR